MGFHLGFPHCGTGLEVRDNDAFFLLFDAVEAPGDHDLPDLDADILLDLNLLLMLGAVGREGLGLLAGPFTQVESFPGGGVNVEFCELRLEASEELLFAAVREFLGEGVQERAQGLGGSTAPLRTDRGEEPAQRTIQGRFNPRGREVHESGVDRLIRTQGSLTGPGVRVC